MNFKFHIICLFLFIGFSTSYGQETREDIEKKANSYFEEKNFLEATPLYLRLLSLDPRDHNYNYRYGTCLLFNSKKKQSAFKYLQFAVKGANVDDEAFYYLGKAYHLTYQFKKAISNYEKYMAKAGSRALRNLDVERQIEMCRNGLSLLSKLSETIVLSKQEIDISDFFRIYNLEHIGGEIIVTEAFQNRQDKRNEHVPIIHFPSNTNRIYYSSYGNNGDNKDIYTRKRLPDGSWSLEQKVKGEINTEYDEDFPYLHPNGRYLYFSSKGHNSMGGYDIFRSKYDPENDDFGKPVNLDFAISSADDDFLYVVDSLNKYAYFASTRESEIGKVNVYNVRVERFPVQIAIIKGTFNSTIDPNNKDLSIRISNANTGEKIGNFETSKNGDYLLTLPKGGQYEFTLQVGGKDTDYKQVIDVPYLREFRPLKQKIVETIQNEQEIVLVSNKFDEEFDDPVAIMAEVIKQQSTMSVNKESFDLDSLDQMQAQRKVLAELGLENFSNIEIVQLADDKVSDLSKRLETSQNKVLKAQKTIENSKKVIVDAYRRADSLSQLANQSDDPAEASSFHRRANQALQTVKNQQSIIENSKVLEEFLSKDVEETEKKLKEAEAFNNKLHAVDRNDNEAFLKVISDNKTYIGKVLLEETLIDAQFEYMDELEAKLTKSKEQKSRIAQLKEQRKQLQDEIAQLEEEVKNARRRKKESLQMELDSKRNQLSDLDNETDYLEKQIEKSEKLQEQKDIVSLVDQTDVPEDFSPSSGSDDLNYNEEEIAELIKSNDEAIEKIQPQSEQAMPESITAVINKLQSSEDRFATGEISEKELLSTKQEQLNTLKNEIEKLDDNTLTASQKKSLDDLIQQLEEEIDKIQEKIKIRNTTDLTELSTEEKQELIKEIKEEIETLSTQSEEKKTEIDARKEIVEELEKEILVAEGKTSTDETTKPLTKTEKDEIIATVDPDYTATVNELKQQADVNPEAQLELLEKQKAFLKDLETAINETNEAINNGDNTAENKRKKAVLEEKKAQVEQEIKALEGKISTDKAAGDIVVSAEEKAAIIADADKKYITDVKEIQEDIDAGTATEEELIERKEKHKEQLQKALDKASKKLDRNPEDEELQKEQQVLTEAIQEVDSEINTLKESASPLTSREKDEIIATVDPDYTATVNELKQQADVNPEAQLELLEKQKAYVKDLETAINETNEAINNGENTAENKRKKAVLEEKKAQVEQEIKALEGKISSDKAAEDIVVSAEEKAAIIANADKKYIADIKEIQEDIYAGTATEEELVERKEKHKEQLQKALDKASKKLDRNPEDEELQKEQQVLTEAIQEVDSEINNLTENQHKEIVASVTEEEKEKILAKAGGKARIEIGNLEQQAKINPAKIPALLEAKNTYLKALERALIEVEQKLEKDPNDAVSKKEVAVLNEEKRKVEIEIGELEKETILSDQHPELADERLSETANLTSEEVKALEQPSKDIKNLNDQLSALEKIESHLLKLRNDTTDDGAIVAIDKKINQVREKSRSVLISIGEVSQEKETIASAVKETKENFTDSELKKVEKNLESISDLEKEKEELINDLASADSERAKKRTQKKIEKTTDKIIKEEVAILEKTTEKSNEILTQQLIHDDLTEENTELDGIGSRKSYNEAQQLINEAENTKDPERKKRLLLEAQEKQQKAIEQSNTEKRKRRAKILIGDVTKEMDLSNIDPETVSDTKVSIEAEQQKIGVKIEEIDEEVAALEVAIERAKKRDQESLIERKDAFLELKKILAKKYEKNELVLQEMNAQEIADKNDGVSKNALSEPISYEEEVAYAQNEEYVELFQISKRIKAKTKEINQTNRELENLKKQLNQLTVKLDPIEEPSSFQKQATELLLKEINEKEKKLEMLRFASSNEQQKLEEKLPTDTKKRNIAENLIKRGVDPIEKAPSLPVMSTGIVLTDSKQTYSDDNPIPLKPMTPGGLVFRVQIGAFSKPVPNNTFNDFTPVTGEQVRPGLIRYMAGFFPSRDNATEARDKIRTLGYSDAFVVAYCDGERIPVYRAQQLLASGACVPSISSPEKPVYTETEATADDFDPNTSFEEELDEFAYNKAPGAAEADVAEKIMGLYYTVQVGVYNKPVSASQLKNISPLITKRLDNGQMRYSSGIFDNVPDARIKRSEAVGLGITDAYIVAYYKGKRISVSQASKLVEEHGEMILESKNPTTVKRNKVTSKVPDVEPEPEPYLKGKNIHVQLESKENFVLYPTGLLNTYNQTDGLFYYDAKSSTIKSFLYAKDTLPSLKGLENQFTQHYYYKGYHVNELEAEVKNNALTDLDSTKSVLTAKIQFTDLNDDLFNYIQKAPLLKHMEVLENGIVVTFITNRSDQTIKNVQINLARFGASELILTELEITNND